jgi:cytochrome c peroxidase
MRVSDAIFVTWSITIPLGLDLYLPSPEENPITAEKIELGRRLFTDRRLSRDGTIACVSCHDPARAFSDGLTVPVGVFGRLGKRNAPALVNRGYGRAFFWDARSAALEEQVLKPIEDPNEMDLPVVEAARRAGVTPAEMSQALASYVRSLVSGNSAYDRFVNGDRSALTADEQAGLQILRGKGTGRAADSSGQGQLHRVPRRTGFLRRADAQHGRGSAGGAGGAEGWRDEGRGAITGREEDRGAFKTPTLRDVALSAPYMHDGSLATLSDVVDYYDRGGNGNPSIDPELHPLRLLPGEKQSLVAFLRSLSGKPDP